MPEAMVRSFGYGLYQAQCGAIPDIAKPLKGFGGREIWELVDDDEHGTFRVVYLVRYADAIFVLHAFQKKSKKGIETTKQDMDLIEARMKWVDEIYKEWNRSK